MGVDVGGTSIKWVVLAGERIATEGMRETPTSRPEDVLAAVVDIVRSRPEVNLVGVALPAVIDAYSGASVLAPNLPGDWAGQAIVEPLSTKLGVPVTLCNDARAFTNAEWRLGAARGYANVIAVTLGTGVGGGIVADGRLLRGSQGRAGELGHVRVQWSDIRCECGAVGCLETLAGARAFVRQAREAIEAGLDTRLSSLSRPPTGEAVVDAARNGDAVAARIIGRAGRAIGAVVAALAGPLATEIVVVGGGLGGALDPLGPLIENQLHERAAFSGACRVKASSLGLYAGAVGAALWKDTQ
jgi:glucokinase